MENPFDNMIDSALEGDGGEAFDADGGDSGDGSELAEGFEDSGDAFAESDGELAADGEQGFDGAAEVADLGDGFDAGSGDGFSEGADDMALWNAFEEEVADGLDAADEDEFLGRLLGGLGRAGGLARSVAHGARRVGQVAGQAGRLAARVSPAAGAAARLARMLGAPGLAAGLDTVGRGARTAGRLARHAGGLAGGVGRGAAGVGQALGGMGQAAQSGQALLAQISQLIGGGGSEFDDFESLADLFEDGVDEALPGMVGLAARAAARGLGFRNVAQLSAAGRRALVRGVGAAARELMRGRDPAALRQLPRIAQAAGRTATRTTPTPQAAAQTLRRGLPRTARNLARNPQALPRAPRPLARPTGIGRGTPTRSVAGPRTFRIDGPVTLSIIPR